MSVLALWADLPWLEDFEDEDASPLPAPELLTISAGVVHWTAADPD